MIDILVGLNVTDPGTYAKYREEMTPLLEAHGGSFGLDVWVSEVLRSPGDKGFNRLFTIRFPSVEAMETLFSLPEYIEIRKRLFDPSVSTTARLARYQVL